MLIIAPGFHSAKYVGFFLIYERKLNIRLESLTRANNKIIMKLTASTLKCVMTNFVKTSYVVSVYWLPLVPVYNIISNDCLG